MFFNVQSKDATSPKVFWCKMFFASLRLCVFAQDIKNGIAFKNGSESVFERYGPGHRQSQALPDH